MAQMMDTPFIKFAGMNTQAFRTAIADPEFSWLENVMPIGDGNLLSLDGPSAALYNIASGTIAGLYTANLNNQSWSFLLSSDGSFYGYNHSSSTGSLLAATGTFSSVQVAQWKNERILILDATNGYYSFDGTNLTVIGSASTAVVDTGGSGFTSVPTVTVGAPDQTGGVQMVLTATIAGGAVTGLTIETGGTGYTSVPPVNISGGGGSGATAHVTLLASMHGDLIAVFGGRTWIVQGRTLLYTNVDSYSYLGGAGGNTVFTDPSLYSTITALYVNSGYLYVFGQNSAFVIGNLQVSNGITTFSNTLVESNIGTGFPLSVQSYQNALVFFNPAGIYALFGVTPSKASDPMDGIVTNIDLVSAITSAVAVIQSQLCYLLCVNYHDTTGYRNIILCTFNQKWFVLSQGVSRIAPIILGGQSGAVGTDSTSLYRITSGGGASVTRKIQTKLHDFSNAIMSKLWKRIGITGVFPATVTNVTFNYDTDTTSQSETLALSASLVFTGADGNPLTFTGAGSSPLTFNGKGFIIQYGSADKLGMSGHYLGLTLELDQPGVQINSYWMQTELQTPWSSQYGS